MRVTITEATAGMVLREPTTNHQGQILLNAGVEIHAKHLRILRSWGVGTIDVEDPLSRSHPADSGGVDERVEEIVSRFRRVRDDPVLDQIMTVLVNRIRSPS